MAKLILTDIASGFASIAALNANNTAIENAIENTLSRDGTGPNYMTSDLDLNGNRILNQGNPITVTGFNWEGPWVTATEYAVGDVVEDNNSSYIAIEDHTSGTFAIDLAANKWQVVASSASLPSQSGSNGKILTTDGSNASWISADTISLPLSGGTLTGTLNGTNIALSGDASVAGALTVTGNSVVNGAGTFGDIVVLDDLTVVGLITPSQTEGIKGTTTNNSANAGSVGEFTISNLTEPSALSLTTGVSKTIVSIILTAGDWDVSATANITLGASTSISAFFGGISLTNNTADYYQYSYRMPAWVPGAVSMGSIVPNRRISISSTTTIYMVMTAFFTVSTCKGWGFISARRMR